MRVTVHFFAVLRDRSGERERTVDVFDGMTVQQLYAHLFPALDEALPVMFAVNQQYVQGAHGLRDGDEVAFIPPLGGG